MERENYFIQQTEEGPFIFLIQARKDQAFIPTVQYDQDSNLLLLRTPVESILLDSIPHSIQEELKYAPYVEIAEIDTEKKEIYRFYEAPLEPMKISEV